MIAPSRSTKKRSPKRSVALPTKSKARSARRSVRAHPWSEIIRLEGERELQRPLASLWWSGVAAGISFGFSFLSQAALAAGLPQSQWNHILASLGYSVGFIIVILGRQQLFTENVLTAVLPVITRWRVSWFVRMLRLWGIVLAANIVGCFLFACAFALLPMLGGDVTGEMAKLVENLMHNSPWEMFAKGIGAGWLIASVVWIIASVSSGQFLVIGLLTYLISLLQFTHIVAGTAEVLYGWVAGLLTFYDASVKFFLPTLAGNVFGGTILFQC